MSRDRTPRRRPLLARLDERIVPRLGGALRGVSGARRRAGAATGPPGRGFGRIVRREPTITATVVIVAAAAVLLTATGGDRHHAVPPARPNAAPTPSLPGDVLGPTVGQPVSTYLAVAQRRLKAIATDVTPQPVTAVVDLTGYLTPAALEAQLNGLVGVQVIRAFAQVAPPAAGDIHTVTLTSGSDLGADLDALRAQAHTLVVNYRKRVSIEQSDPSAANEAVVTAYADEARQAKIDAAGIGAGSGCVFALVVTGPANQLTRLAVQPDVRVLDPAPTGVSRDSLMIVPLEPQTIATVPPLEFAGD